MTAMTLNRVFEISPGARNHAMPFTEPNIKKSGLREGPSQSGAIQQHNIGMCQMKIFAAMSFSDRAISV